ncbi:Acetyl/propionyl-CoA carboxylase, alpha subunit [Actinokineospora alba]|uniref:biotin carboxylase n=1 Tax=Actinokineospora alba TaxID=504798 RepID=A0A1H0F2G1_9PSEU|nr:carboxyl transferase domain-containing protein [Actinokineospora alba]TDP69311.1 acetyl/propionyl-CoA carboxylase alpha subunit [Actinokineospora alba]SDI19565.1 Acetyl/propionyl-CoA carboxylase, alpha subunit [Actinokineospora alba]SDN88736.1 Acetyl/propionyl-CoA carboxylase, alpha subunit [Actinokineospora alba]
MFRRIAIVNRGEAAMRLIHAARELAAQTGTPIETVALHTDVDRNATFVRAADVAYNLGPASARPYLDLKVLKKALVETKPDAAWVGWGFVAEDPAFASLCEEVGVTFVGPSPDAMRKLGDKIGAKLIAEEVGVPVAPWSRGPVESLDAALAAAAGIGYPLMLKATAGGGGRGIRVVTNDADLADAYERTSQEAARAFGSGVVFLERLVTGARHVEVQVIADGQGTAWALGVRDCSIQRRNQKIIEESASPVLSAEQTAELKSSAERLAIAVGYRGAATVEFLYHPGDKVFAFLEVNTRLQVEHPITEATTGFDLVKAQLWVASGNRLEGAPPVERGHAVEARLNAEDPDRDFAPSPGRIVRMELPSGPGIRVDTGVREGDTIPADFDSMIAKIIAHGRDRTEALGRLRHAMAATTVIIDGGATNKSFVLDLLDQPEVIDASADTGWIDRVRAEGRLVAQRHSAVAIAAAAIQAYEEEEGVEQQRLLSTAFGGRPQVRHESGRRLDLKLRGATYRVRVTRIGAHRFRVGIEAGRDARTADVELDRFDQHAGRIRVNGVGHRLLLGTAGPVVLVEVDGVAHRVSRDEGGVLRSPAPALVVATPVAAGSEVEAGAPVLVLESMKMETVLRAPFAARIKECTVAVGSLVETGAPLLRLEPLAENGDAADTAADVQVDWDLAEAGPEVSAADRLQELCGQLLGYDVDPQDDGGVLRDYLAAREAGGRPLAEEVRLVTIFADLADLSRNRPAGEDISGESHLHSAREYFHTYLQSLDVDRAGLPERFQAKLAKALAHYGVTDLERTPELEAAVFRIFLAQQRATTDAGVVATLLRAWLREPPPDEALREPVGLAMEHLIAATQVRFPVVSDLARGVVFAWLGQPMLRRNRARVYADVRKHVRYLAANPDAADRDERIAQMVRTTEPLVRVLSQYLERNARDNAIMLDVLTRRYYGNKRLVGIQTSVVSDRTYVTAERTDFTVVSTAARHDDLPEALRGLGTLAAGAGPLEADIYLAWRSQPEDAADLAAELAEVVSAHPLPPQVRRLTLTVAGRGGDVMHQHITFRPSESGLAEDRLIRGLHPYIAQRMQLERLREFDLTRLPSADEDVYLFHCVARENRGDERLVAFTQVRDLVGLRDHDGRLVALPTAENTLATCLDSIRRAQGRRPAAARFNTNRIVVYVWQASDITPAELEQLANRILPTTAGACLEEIEFILRQRHPKTGELVRVALRISFDATGRPALTFGEPSDEPVLPLDSYRQKVVRASSRNTVYPYEITSMIGEFTEYDLDDDHALVPVDRPRGKNSAAIVAGVVRTPTARHPQGVTRVVLLGDPTTSLGALAEPECRRVIAALDLAERLQVPVEWYTVSSGARISMESGTENMDWVAAALKRIVTFTQDGGEINIVVAGINVGAQPYWNAEATMLMHTKGILVMTPDSAMVLTGKQSLDFSGGVSAEDNFGIGGYDRVMGPNGQAQYWAPDLGAARDLLMSYYDHTYVAPGEDGPRRVETTDPRDRDVTGYPHRAPGSDFTSVGEIFSAETNPDRKKAFDIRVVMRALSDQDRPVLERWAGMADAETAVVQDAHLGGIPVCMVGIESRSVQRRGFPPTDGPDTYTSGTLFPKSSKKVARAINAASGNRPLVVLANLSGFDGSPESMRKLQLEYGAEIGRAIVNFRGPIVFCVISRYHGGAFVVFSKALNPNMTVLALEGSFASVLGGAPAAAVVFTRDVAARIAADPRVRDLETRSAAAVGADRASLTAELDELRATVRAEKLSEVAGEFDRVHNIGRAVEVGSVDAVIRAAELRPRVIEAIEARLG